MLPSLWLLALSSALAGPPTPLRTVLSGHLSHAPAGDTVRVSFGSQTLKAPLSQMAEFASALKKKFEGRDMVFLYISVGDPEAKWQQVLTSQHFTGPNSVHLRSPNTDEAIAYQVNGYPSYYLIGRDGRFIDLYTSRPSDGDKTVAAIEQALAR